VLGLEAGAGCGVVTAPQNNSRGKAQDRLLIHLLSHFEFLAAKSCKVLRCDVASVANLLYRAVQL
jgi:hypothetical protein